MPTVLIVEDEAIVRDLVAEELDDAGFTVVIAVNADHAISILENRLDIHLVFTDIDMPGSMDGLKLAAAVRDRWPPIHIIITTGKARPLEIPANALFIPKPLFGKERRRGNEDLRKYVALGRACRAGQRTFCPLRSRALHGVNLAALETAKLGSACAVGHCH